MTSKQIFRFSKMKLWLLALLLCSTSAIMAQNSIQIKGIISDDQGPIPGVSVQIKGTLTGVATNAMGTYSIDVPNDNAILVFSCIGYLLQEIKVGNKTELNIAMKTDLKMLDEVVVIGYGTSKKSDLTGSVSSVSADAMNSIPTTNIGEMLRGQSAGIEISTESFRPGGSSSIMIRGKNSLKGSTAPLFVLDGVPVDNIDDINSIDIKSVEVLKDASAQSIYGARAANGVILVTTHKGEKGKTVIDFNTYVMTQWLHKNFDRYNGEEFAQLRREAYRTASSNGEYVDDNIVFNPAMLDALNKKEFTDWEDIMLSNANAQKYDLSVRKGSENSNFSTSLGYFKHDGMVDNSSFERMTYRLNADHKIFSNLTLGANFFYTMGNQSNEYQSFYKMVTMDPLSKAYDDDGNMLSMTGDQVYSPLFDTHNSYNRSKTNRMLINAFMDWQIFDGLKYRLNSSVNSRIYERNEYQNSKHSLGKDAKGIATVDNRKNKEYLIENILNYYREINADHNIDATLMQSVNELVDTKDVTSASGFNNDLLGHEGIPSASLIRTPDRRKVKRNLLSYMGRVRYSLMDKYLLTASLRIDGSSVFGANNKYGYFPSFAFGWKMNNETFMKDIKSISTLKPRISYGSVGNQGLSPYQSIGLVETYGMMFGENEYFTGYLPNSELHNPNLKWETSTSTNIGIDFGFLSERITGTIEYYNTITKDLLMTRALKESSGYSTQMVNMGKIRNRGLEVSITGYPISTKDVTWSVSLNWSKNVNKIIALNGEKDVNGRLKDNLVDKWFINNPIDVYYEYAFDGIWQEGDDIANSHMPNAKPGDIRIKDLDGDKEITPEDRTIIKRDPDWIGSLSSTLKYKGFDLGIDLYMKQGGLKENRALHFYDYGGGSQQGKMNGIKVNYWLPENPSNEYPRPSRTGAQYLSSLSYQDASYFRIRNIILGYTLPVSLTKKAYMQKVRVYASVNNIYTSTNYQSYGPETSPNGYPEPISFTAGLGITF